MQRELQTLGRKVAGSILNPGRSVVSFSKTFHPHCLVLVKPRKPSQNDWKIVDRDIKPQTNKKQTYTKSRFYDMAHCVPSLIPQHKQSNIL